MKKIWKALGFAALAATVIPYRIHKDQEEDVTSVDALLWQATHHSGKGEDKNQVDITFGFKSPFQEVREERGLFTDNPDEAVLYTTEQTLADDAAAEEDSAATDGAESKMDETEEPEVTEEDFDPDL